MRPILVLLTLAIVVAIPDYARAITIAIFDVREAGWAATHIVIVTEGNKIDGDVEVLASWKGDLKKGDRLTIPALAAFAPADKRLIHRSFFSRDDPRERAPGAPTHVTCSRVILFLVKENPNDPPAKAVWRPAQSGWMNISMLWIEKGRVYAFAQDRNDLQLMPWCMSEHDLEREVDQVMETQTALARTLALPDAWELSAAIQMLLKSDPEFTSVIFDALDKAGKKAMPALGTLAKDESLGWYWDRPFKAMVKTGAECVEVDLTEALQEELAYWKKVGPGLKGNWEYADGNRYRRTLGILEALEKIKYAPCKPMVIEFRNFWRAQPQLGRNDTLDQVCNTILKALP